ncbi:MAG: MarR family transcriptional regulator [Pseudomonadota bacterium]
MSAPYKVQYAPMPVEAGRDMRLSRNDFAVLMAIAYRDRFGKNGMGCTLGFRKLAEEAGVDPSHLSRHTRRLEELGYITVTKSATDKRRRSYSVVYSTANEAVATDGDYQDANPGATVSPGEKVVATDGEYPEEIVAIANLQAIEKKDKALPNRSCINKQNRSSEALSAANHENRGTVGPPFAQQGERDRSAVPKQRELPVLQDVNQKTRNQKRLAAEERLGNDLVKAQLIEPLEDWAAAERDQDLGATAEYQKAIDCEARHQGNGLKYLLKIAKVARLVA